MDVETEAGNPSRGACTEGLKQQGLFPTALRLEVQDQGVCWAGSFAGGRGESGPLPELLGVAVQLCSPLACCCLVTLTFAIIVTHGAVPVSVPRCPLL